MPRSILFFGDSNTWGYVPGLATRHDADTRWTGIVRKALPDWIVIEEGLSGRTTMLEDPVEGPMESRSGYRYLIPCLASHLPLDVFSVMLGGNDLKRRFDLTPFEISQGIDAILKHVTAASRGATRMVVMAPAPIAPTGGGAELFEGGAEKSHHLAAYYKAVAERHGALFLDTAEHWEVDPADGVHFGADAHSRVGQAVADMITANF